MRTNHTIFFFIMLVNTYKSSIMSDDKFNSKIDDVKGNVKEGAGKLVNSDDWKAEGKADQAKSEAEYKKGQGKQFGEGIKDKIEGGFKSFVGGVTNNEDLQAEGEKKLSSGDSNLDNAKN